MEQVRRPAKIKHW